MKRLFEPRSVAVVGASRRRGKIGSEILHNLLAARFRGRIYPVNPASARVAGRRSYPSVRAVPGTVDLAVLAIPAAAVEAAVDDCIARGVRALVIISAGFRETGGEGRQREAAILAKVRAAGIRMVGPNCMGLINTDPRVRLNATFSPVHPPEGRVGLASQSGALGIALLDEARRLNLGISTFVSVGNKADVSGNDLVQYWSEDPRTDVILLLPRELRLGRKLHAHRQAGRAPQADRRGEGRPLPGRRARGFLAHRRPRRERRRRRRALATGGHHPRRDARGALRRLDAAGPPAVAGGPPRRDPDQLRWAGDPRGRCL